MASSHQGIPILSNSATTIVLPEHFECSASTDRLPRIQASMRERKYTQTDMPVTPGQTVPPHPSVPTLHVDNAVPPDDGITTIPERPEDFCAVLASDTPSRVANIRVRRSQHGSTLTHSPARAGHTARMRQIFEDASREHCTPQGDRGVLYPQLPNISRRASPPRDYNGLNEHDASCGSPNHQQGSVCMSTGLPLAIQQPEQSQANHLRLSGSWSDDSGYFIADTFSPVSAITVSPKKRIYDWLESVAESEANAADNTAEDGSHAHLQSVLTGQPTPCAHEVKTVKVDETSAAFPSTLSYYPFERLGRFEDSQAIAQDPFVHNGYISAPSLFNSRQTPACFHVPSSIDPPQRKFSDICKRLNFGQTGETPVSKDISSSIIIARSPLAPNHNKQPDSTPSSPIVRLGPENDALELSPLSPNVCTERGPSRYHKSPIIGRVSTPCKEQPSITLQAARLKENVFLQAESPSSFGSPRAPRCTLLRAGFQRPQHNGNDINGDR